MMKVATKAPATAIERRGESHLARTLAPCAHTNALSTAVRIIIRDITPGADGCTAAFAFAAAAADDPLNLFIHFALQSDPGRRCHLATPILMALICHVHCYSKFIACTQTCVGRTHELFIDGWYCKG